MGGEAFLIRMIDKSVAKEIFLRGAYKGKSSQDGHNKNYKDTLKASLNDFTFIALFLRECCLKTLS